MTTGESTKPRSIAPQHQLSHPSSQPKSCLKKHLDDGATIVHNETPHVKSMSGGQESTSTEQIVAKSIINNHVNGCSSFPWNYQHQCKDLKKGSTWGNEQLSWCQLQQQPEHRHLGSDVEPFDEMAWNCGRLEKVIRICAHHTPKIGSRHLWYLLGS